MFDATTAAVIIAAILGCAAPVTAAILRYGPNRTARPRRTCGGPSRITSLESRVAVVEANYANVTKSLDDFRNEVQDGFRELRETILENIRKVP